MLFCYEKHGTNYTSELRVQKQRYSLWLTVVNNKEDIESGDSIINDESIALDLRRDEVRGFVRTLAEYITAWLNQTRGRYMDELEEIESVPRDRLHKLEVEAIADGMSLTIFSRAVWLNAEWFECPREGITFNRRKAEDVAAAEQLASLLCRAVDD